MHDFNLDRSDGSCFYLISENDAANTNHKRCLKQIFILHNRSIPLLWEAVFKIEILLYRV